MKFLYTLGANSLGKTLTKSFWEVKMDGSSNLSLQGNAKVPNIDLATKVDGGKSNKIKTKLD